MKSGSKPEAPDPVKVAGLQGAEDRKTLQYGLNNSRTSTVNPFGSTSWNNNKTFDQAGFDQAMSAYSAGAPKPQPVAQQFSFDGQPLLSTSQLGGTAAVPDTRTVPNRSDFETDSWTNKQTLSPQSQGIYDTATSKLGDAMKGISTDPRGYNSGVADAVFNRLRRYQDPLDAAARSSQQSNLADRGFAVGNEAYGTEMDRLDRTQSMGVADAADRAQITGATQGMAELSMQQQIAQMLQGMRGAQVGGVSSMPSTTTTPSIQAPDIAGMTMQKYGNELDAYNANQAGNNALLGSLIQAGGMAVGGGAGGGLGSIIAMMGNKAVSGGNAGTGMKQPKSGYWNI